MRRFVLAVLTGFAALPAVSPGAAAQTCFTLQAELSHLQDEARSARDTTRYERAYREQARVLARTEDRARDAGCFGGRGFLFFRPDPEPICRTLIPRLNEMQDNLDRLDVMRRRGGGGGTERRMRAIQRAMDSRGCDGDQETDMRSLEARGGEEWGPDGQQPYSASGTYRTLCVRTCDGYYFPISFSTTEEQFGQDAQTCSAMCPAAETQLFYHANPGGSADDMTSVVGQPYSSLPNAFKYRTSLDPSCTCRPAGGMGVANAPPDDPGGQPRYPQSTAAPVPQPRPEPGEDPETLADRAGHFVPGAPAAPAASAVTASSASGHPVRVVGPTIGPSPEQAGVVLVPVPN